jgi:putative ABC transport system permease protein
MMLNSYFKIAWRNLMKYKFISFINLFGLTVGLTCCLLILTYIRYELSYDRYNQNADRVYRLTRDFNNENGDVSMRMATVAPPFGYYLPTDFPQIQKMTRLLDNGNTPLRYRDKLINQQNVFFADENIFDVFTIDIVKGSSKTALSDPFSVMITEENARKYFGDEDPIGKVIKCDNQYDLKVTGVYHSFPSNAHIHPGILVSFNTLKRPGIYGEENLRSKWDNNAFLTYLLLPKNYDVSRMVARFPAFIDSHMPHDRHLPSKGTKLNLQKLAYIHLYSHTDNEEEAGSDISRIYIFSAIALFILLIACINYMNLSTARSALRAREIGIRKVIGAGRTGLVLQFLGESVIIASVAVLLATGLLCLLLPWLSKLSGMQLSAGILWNGYIIVPLLLTPLVIGTLSGLYPALFLSAFQPLKTLKGITKTGSSIPFQKVLVVIQFSISIILMITTMIVFEQLNFLRNKPLGYNKDQMIIVPYTYKFGNQFDAFKNELLSNPNIKNVTRSSRIPTGRLLDDMNAYTFSGDASRPVSTAIKYVAVDEHFLSTYGILIAAGRDFSAAYSADTLSYILNESAVRAIGWKTPQDAVGQDFKYGKEKGHVIGIVKDFNFESMHQQIVPVVFKVFPPGALYFTTMSVKITGNSNAALTHLEACWKKFLPETPFEYTFLDEKYNALYQSEQKQGTLFTIFAGIAIFIACLGLFGLSAFATSQRVSEIGIRKVLGANVESIVMLVSKDFLKLIAIAAMVAFPLAWYAMSMWLRDFAYHVSIHWWVLLLAGLATLLVAAITISSQAIKAAVANPIKSLRNE